MPSSHIPKISQIRPIILIVDDQEIISDVLQQQLSSEFNVRVAHSGKQAIEFCGKHTPDLILMDVYMPEMDGIEVCRHINQRRLTLPIPVIFSTSAESVEIESQCWEVGGVDFVTKPVQKENLIHKIKVHLAMKTRVEILDHHTRLKAPTQVKQPNWYIEFLEKQCEAASLRHMPLSVVMIKIRDFDQLIRIHGWTSIDDKVTHLSKLIVQELFHTVDVMVRYQRDKFLCILPDSGPEATRHFAFMLQRAIAKHDPLQLTNKCNPAFLGIAGITKLDGKYDAATILAEIENCIEKTLAKPLGILSAERVSNDQHFTQIISAHNG
jgi:PleD family two-component response regulator